jgi:RimJ/RimL family protein N-acetyltransferase
MLPPAPITTARLTLRVPHPTDLTPLRELYDDPIATRHIGTQTAWTPERAAHRLHRWIRHHKMHGYGPCTMQRREDDAVAGIFGIELNEDDLPELSIMLIRNYWKYGYATEAAAAFLPLAQQDPRFPRLITRMESAHPARPHLERSIFLRYGFHFDRLITYHGTPMHSYTWRPDNNPTPDDASVT